MKVRKDPEITVLEFRKVESYPIIARIVLALAFITAIISYWVTKSVGLFFLSMIVGLAIYVLLAFKFRCPDCGAFLWNLKNKKKLKKCPKCQAVLKK